MKVFFTIAAGVFALIIVFLLMGALALMGSYNHVVTLDEEVSSTWANVETQYQRRADLIPNLVRVVEGYSIHEKEVLTSVIEARASVNDINVDVKNASPEQLMAFQQAQGELGSALSRLMVTVERYPNLKADQQYLNLQDELAGTENRITVARTRYNDAVRNVNTYQRQFIGRFIASLAGVTPSTYYEADQGSEDAPTVEFNG